MKEIRQISFILFTGALLLLHPKLIVGQNAEDCLAVARSAIQADRHATVSQTMQLTEAEAEEFWPLYHQYRTDLAQLGNSLQELVIEYAQLYPNVPEDRAKKMLKQMLSLEKELTSKRAWYMKKFGRVLPADKTLRFAQVENRLDLVTRLELAANIPLVPIEGKLSGRSTESIAFAQGVPGLIQVKTFELTATVAAIDRTTRNVTLVNAEGIKETVKAGPEVVNFDQIRMGDQLKVTATEKLVVQMAAPGQSADNHVTDVVALAPQGAKPGGVMANAVQVTGKITAIDRQKRTATLRFEDGAAQTFPVRDDVDLTQRKVGEDVVFRVTEMVAVSMKKP